MPAIQEYDLENMWFQQHGAICHITRANMNSLQETFPGRVLSRSDDINRPPRSCDLTPLDPFLWGYKKGRVYADTPSTLEHLKSNILQVMAEIPQNILLKNGRKLLQKIMSTFKF